MSRWVFHGAKGEAGRIMRSLLMKQFYIFGERNVLTIHAKNSPSSTLGECEG